MQSIPSNISNDKPLGLPTIRIDKVDEIKKAHNSKIRFSFKCFDRQTEYFTLSEAPQSWFITLLDELKEISKHNWVQFNSELKGKYEPHIIDWDDVTAKFPFKNVEQYDSFQFRLSASKGRVAGFLLGNIFYIVWLDQKHFLYPPSKGGKGYEKPRKMASAKTCYEKLSEEFEKTKMERDEYFSLLDKQTTPTPKQVITGSDGSKVT